LEEGPPAIKNLEAASKEIDDIDDIDVAGGIQGHTPDRQDVGPEWKVAPGCQRPGRGDLPESATTMLPVAFLMPQTDLDLGSRNTISSAVAPALNAAITVSKVTQVPPTRMTSSASL
jgi:hypothetical protein